ncbi:hypothetical protein [Ulvibacterium marinum]|uniref:Outer membrane protein beta-barrel domain-containing protein n=1 Tax=Ulvibacterium marinum TaxID=2419782 RepID=A0A3B0CDZ9_9FLAO|nr:hypothetical protein [Ulvibacterium marinum]RKN81196.1 hypothetical protein D7Z94_09650 [Ulvibacterium marinum]
MRRKPQLLLLFLLQFTFFGYGQKKSKSQTTNTRLSEYFWDRTEFKVGFVGTVFWSNGLSVGAEYLWKESEKTKSRRGKERTNTHQFLFNGNLGFVTNFSSKTDTGAYTNFGLTWRRTNKKGKQFSIELNPLGYYRSFLPETYEVNGDEVNKVFLPGRGYYAPSLSVGIGRWRKGKVRSGSYFNINYTMRTSYNAGALPTFSFQYGFRFNFKNKKQ